MSNNSIIAIDLAAISSYMIITLSATIVAYLGYAIWKRAQGPEFLVMPALLYYYTMFGAWTILPTLAGNNDNPLVDHFQERLFYVRIDDVYVLSLFYYSIYLVVFMIGIAVVVRPFTPDDRNLLELNWSKPSIGRLLSVSLIALPISFAFISDDFISAIDSGISIYSNTRSSTSVWFPLHQLFNRVGLIALGVAWPLLVTIPRSGKWYFVIASVSSIAWLSYLFVLGNRGEVLITILASAYFYLKLENIRIGKQAMLALIFFIFLFIMKITSQMRGLALTDYIDVISGVYMDPGFWTLADSIQGAESIAAHLSMYGVLVNEIQYTWGLSILYFLQSIIPRFIYDSRVESSYDIYASAAHLPVDQGFNIHYAAGAYLNFGILGIIVFVVLLVGIFRWVNRPPRLLSRTPSLMYPWLIGYCFFCAALPIAMRGGPEGLKGLLIEGFLIPFVVSRLSITRRVRVV